ncbi:acylneuraminate cytidylyltransferase family protein [Aliiglaciecola sp. 2_MG-2023]|uniref:acylneuraminate cytidylyltransferase family protein n=1 Tax=unclassified Aliiglaciecola TaxID=2593648 RepID=UPI0026E15E42|nr:MULTISPECIES: acylneuraminate cytidylyltransferase family protein [unclassified Aliiglaciecola]MDO6709372.1 acylneuraminate cytidylyltransferase family protein [Aliiglaciecola sp. 2_MG-2023]MDO6750520.1 acylneuraminate cytidylyltransferase family protein [Aliiglaciecola sp. 1_MG-2023]
MTKLLVVIPARSGSKSLPNKNIRLLNGKPLIAHSIEYATSSAIVNKTIISTDSQNYADIAMQFGAEVPFIRPAEYSLDTSQDYEFMRHALDFFKAKNEHYDYLALLRPTSPLRPPKLLEKALEILKKIPSASAVRTVAQVKEHPYRVWRPKDDGSIEGFVDQQHEPYNLPRQQLPLLYFQTGDLEMVRSSTLLAGSVSGNEVYPLVLKHDQMIDIDSDADFNIAEDKIR